MGRVRADAAADLLACIAKFAGVNQEQSIDNRSVLIEYEEHCRMKDRLKRRTRMSTEESCQNTADVRVREKERESEAEIDNGDLTS